MTALVKLTKASISSIELLSGLVSKLSNSNTFPNVSPLFIITGQSDALKAKRFPVVLFTIASVSCKGVSLCPSRSFTSR